jgi:hypothetical protein
VLTLVARRIVQAPTCPPLTRAEVESLGTETWSWTGSRGSRTALGGEPNCHEHPTMTPDAAASPFTSGLSTSSPDVGARRVDIVVGRMTSQTGGAMM